MFKVQGDELMPYYLYACRCVGSERETHHSIYENPVIPCSICGAQMERVPQYVGIQFKGSGFYKNDKSKP